VSCFCAPRREALLNLGDSLRSGGAGERAAATKGRTKRFQPGLFGQDRNEAMRTGALLTLLLIVAVPLAGCATVKGFGRDVESVGEAGSDALD